MNSARKLYILNINYAHVAHELFYVKFQLILSKNDERSADSSLMYLQFFI